MQSPEKKNDDDEPTSGRRRLGTGYIFEAAARGLAMPVTGMEAEFNVVMDGVEIDPRAYWGDPTAFIDAPMLRRERSSLQMPTGGAVYFDRGVIEVVTPVIELAPGCTARVVRNLWEQIAFVRDELTKWEAKAGKHIRLKAYSAHYNVSFELSRREQNEHRNIQKLALLLAHLLPIPLALVGTNRRSTGPRRAPARQSPRGHGGLHPRPRPDDRHRHPRGRHRAGGHRVALVRALGAGRAPAAADRRASCPGSTRRGRGGSPRISNIPARAPSPPTWIRGSGGCATGR